MKRTTKGARLQIFLSHNWQDKPVIEPIALRLAGIFGTENVFYDSWSIQPGDGIIARMNDGLTSPDYVFYFVSASSLASKMVDIEWQNALYASTKGKVKLVPVRVDGSPMPAVLSQNLWIDLYQHGIETALQHIVSVIQGQNTFTPQHLGFSNLTWSARRTDEQTMIIEIKASHLMEPNPMFLILTPNNENEIQIRMADTSPNRGGFNEGVGAKNDGSPLNGLAFAPLGGVITPKLPLRIEVKRLTDVPVGVVSIRHQSGTHEWTVVPMG